MPICDGVEACKRLRVLEGKRRVSVLLPSKLPVLLFRHAAPYLRAPSCCTKRRLPRIHKTVVPQLRNELQIEPFCPRVDKASNQVLSALNSDLYGATMIMELWCNGTLLIHARLSVHYV